MLTQIYNDIKTRLTQADIGIKMIDVWNNQINNTDTETIITPALYIELSDMVFTPQTGGLQAEAIVRIHLIQHQFGEINQSIIINNKILNSLQGIEGDNFTSLEIKTYTFDFDHDMFRHDIFEFDTYIWYETKQVETTEVTPTLNIIV